MQQPIHIWRLTNWKRVRWFWDRAKAFERLDESRTECIRRVGLSIRCLRRYRTTLGYVDRHRHLAKYHLSRLARLASPRTTQETRIRQDLREPGVLQRLKAKCLPPTPSQSTAPPVGIHEVLSSRVRYVEGKPPNQTRVKPRVSPIPHATTSAERWRTERVEGSSSPDTSPTFCSEASSQ